MIESFDRIVIRVPDLAAACDEYATLLGVRPVVFGSDKRAWLALSNTVLELAEGFCEKAAIESLVLVSAGSGVGDVPLDNDLGLDLRVGDGSETAAFRDDCPQGCVLNTGVDHLVLRSVDADRCISLFNGRLGIRLALDQDVPEWGGRMLFFRAGKLTLEVIASHKVEPGAVDAFWGLTLHLPDIEARAAELHDLGVELSEVREGRKPGTRVATVHSHCLGLPTLLLQPAPR
jgi:catechol 2,3-dioxygenase-like lactoylglutathione lyase family enzyme